MKKLFLAAAAIISSAMLCAEIPEPVLDLDLSTGDVKTIKDLSASKCKVIVSAPEKLSWGEGPDGKVLQFNGSRNAPRGTVHVTPPANLNFAKGFTMRFVFKTPDDYKRNIRYQLFQFGKGADAITGITLFLYWRNIHCRFGVKSKTGPLTPATYPLKPSTWYDCAVTYDTKNVIIYLNGKAVSKPYPAKINDIKERYINIGSGAPTGAGYSFKGLLSTVQFYNRALTAAEISNIE